MIGKELWRVFRKTQLPLQVICSFPPRPSLLSNRCVCQLNLEAAEVRPSSAHGIAAQAEIGEHARASEDSAQQPAAAALPNPTVTRAQAVQEAILQADSNEGSKTADIDETNADEPESDSDEDLLAQLSQSMFAALRPQANIKDAPAEAARHRASQNDTAEGDSMRASQPQSLQTNRESPMTGMSARADIAVAAAAASAAVLMLLQSITAVAAA